ncbi:peptidoglycan bridge formation glycyltransferase FemA/FemB family protein [Trueperella bialowiezensis]|nr:peptidoglycan bridge formation glycyltransferase FemA/FemB family protein [Trueperella bialowiezensis]
MTLTFRTLSPEEFSQFTETSELRRFQTQSVEFFRAYQNLGREVELVGLVDDDGDVFTCHGVALVLFTPWRKVFQVARIPFGPILDWCDDAVARAFLTGLVAHLKKHSRVISLTFNPILARNFYDVGSRVPTSSNEVADSFERIMVELGARREEKEFYEDPAVSVRFIYTKNISGLTFDEALPTLAKGLRRRFRHEGRYGVETVMEGPDKWEVFERLHELTVARTGMTAYSQRMHESYREFLRQFGEENAALGIAYLRPGHYIEQLSAERAQLEKRQEELLTRKATKNRDRELGEIAQRFAHIDTQLEAARSTLAEYGEEIPINCAVGFYVDHELVLMIGAMDKRFQDYLRDYPVERAFFKEACDRGMDIYNTFGISGIWDSSAPDAPVLQFKELLNGNVEEFVGTYHLAVRPRLAALAGCR